jgi:hypothetical protein
MSKPSGCTPTYSAGSAGRAWLLASAHAAVGATEEALLWLNRAIDGGMINYPFLSEHDRYLDSVRGDARFHAQEYEPSIKSRGLMNGKWVNIQVVKLVSVDREKPIIIQSDSDGQVANN